MLTGALEMFEIQGMCRILFLWRLLENTSKPFRWTRHILVSGVPPVARAEADVLESAVCGWSERRANSAAA